MTSAQRARLVVAMGLLNLILATVALTAGIVAPTRPGDVAGAGTPGPTVRVPVTSSPSVEPTPTVTSQPGGSAEPTPSDLQPSTEASAVPSSSGAPSEGPIVAEIPTPRPRATGPTTTVPPNAPTPKPTVRPTPHPTPRPTATPAPIVEKAPHPRPPCPDATSGPPGHHKTLPPPSRPCGPSSGHGGGNGANGIVVVLPIALGGLAATIRARFILGSRRLVRATRSRAGRRGTRPRSEA